MTQNQESHESEYRQPTNRRALLLVGVGAAIGLVLLGLATGWILFQVGGPLGPVPTASPTSTFTPSPTYTSTPTATSTFTATATNTPTATNTATPTATTTATATNTPIPIFLHVRTMGKLVLISFELARADIHVGINRGLCSHGADHVAEAAIEAGIDFGAIQRKDITYDDKSDTYSLQLSPPELTSCNVSYIDQYDRSRTWCGTDWGELKLLGEVQSMPEFVKRAQERGIIEKTKAHAEIVLGSFVQSLTGSRADISFRNSNGELQLPQSCIPEPPTGWTFDNVSSSWSYSN